LSKPQQLLVFRFSSLGDVAMTVPVISALLEQNPQAEVIMVSTEFVRPVFSDMERVRFHAADLRGKHKGLAGLLRLFRELNKTYSFDAIADLHDVLRTKVLRGYFVLSGKKMAVIDKGRREKRELTRTYNKKLRPLKSNFERYADVFRKLGFEIDLQYKGPVKKRNANPSLVQLKQNGFQLVGIAPFALHKEKTYPPERMQQVVRLLSNNDRVKIFLLGGKNDAAQLESWLDISGRIELLAGRMSFQEELRYISCFDLVVSMDSANMHLASLYGVPVVSVWGGTHPWLGFYGWGQSLENAVQVNLDCRPSSVFGNEPCHNDLTCMKMISPIIIYERIAIQLKSTRHEIPGH
jgi:ADP-heptose:LPS heptosyltransferase